MRKIVHIQGGQCGNQIRAKFEEDAWIKHEAWEYRWIASVWTYTGNHKKPTTFVKINRLPKSGECEPKDFNLKMICDYYRYTAKSASRDKLAEVTEKASKYYTKVQAESILKINFDLWIFFFASHFFSNKSIVYLKKKCEAKKKIQRSKLIFNMDFAWTFEYQQATEAADSLNIKVDLRWTNYDVSQMNFEVFLITKTYS